MPLEFAPFAALRYDPELLPAALAPPYDVISPAERERLLAASANNVVGLTLPADYARAADLLDEWRAAGVLRRDDEPAVYVYEEAAADGGHVQRGLLGAVRLEEPSAGVILPHENTMAGPVADRLALQEATRANLEPIFLVYSGGGAASEAVASVGAAPPLLDVAWGGLRHRLWALTDPEVLAGVAADLAPRRAVIADGHHRYATYLRYQADRHAAGAGAGPWDYGLALLVDASTFGPQVHPIHRVVRGLSLAEALRRVDGAFEVTPCSPTDEPAGDGLAFTVTDGTDAYRLDRPDEARLGEFLPADRSPAWRALDVAVAHHALIAGLWGVPDTEDNVGYEHDLPAALDAARRDGALALLLRATPVDAVTAVAAAGERMPRKSTLFTPKPATGIVLRELAAPPG